MQPTSGSPIYRLAVDDVIYSFRDLAQRRPASIFDCHFFAMLREVHRSFGTKITLNLFLQTHEGDFSLIDFPDDYQAEWLANASWLKLAFHARQEFPGDAYAGPQLIAFARDYYDVRDQVLRFAGQESWIAPLLIHFCVIPDHSLQTMAGWGVKELAGLCLRDGEKWAAHYGLEDSRAARVAANECVKDEASGITFSLVDVVINNCPLEEIPSALERLEGTPDRQRKINLLTHEQYSWPFYQIFIPDHAERIAAACRWCSDHGYLPSH